MSPNVIRVVGARVHNLKNITVEIPRDKLVIITGLSGSGNPRWHSTPSLPKVSGDMLNCFQRMRVNSSGR